MTELNIKLGGAAGQGLQRAGLILGKMFVRGGSHVFAIQDSESRIRGGHNFFQIRVKDEPIAAMTAKTDLLVAFDKESIEQHQSDLNEGGLVVLDCESLKVPANAPNMIDLPMKKLAVDIGGKALMANSAAMGFISGLVGYGIEHLVTLFKEMFKKDDLAEKNAAVAKAGYELVTDAIRDKFDKKFTPQEGTNRLFLTGNEAIALGALAADIKFMAAYPMSPSTSIITYLAQNEDKMKMVTEQAEDEIAAVNMAFGAAMGGVRAMTATSGGGMALMSETISLAGAAEVPLVIVDCQRPGPATGLPTRTDQSDLLFAIYTGHGEFTRAVLAPGNAEQAFFDTTRAFNIAEKYQIPVILLAEQYLGDSYWTVDPFDMSKVTHETSLLTDEEAAKITDYKRYKITDDGISPRMYPGQTEQTILTDNHAHDETGHISEDGPLHMAMVDKWLRKAPSVIASYDSPEVIGKADAGTMLLAWGSSREPIAEAVRALVAEGEDIGLLYYDSLWPYPTEATKKAIAHNPRLIAVEGNATAQLKQITQQHTGRCDIETHPRYDGRPFMADELYPQLKERLTR